MPVTCWLGTRSAGGREYSWSREKKESEAFEEGVDMPGACQLSGNVVPAVGKCEGATPRRIQTFSDNMSKKFYPTV